MGTLRIISHSSDPFADRHEAGGLLAGELEAFSGRMPVVLGIPRGGVILAGEIARQIGGQLDIVLTRKLGSPGNPELAIGAVSENGTVLVNERIASGTGATPAYIEMTRRREAAEIARRSTLFRSVASRIPLARRLVILTDDGVATGATMQASLMAARQEQPARLVCALPVGPEDTLRVLAEHADEVICLRAPAFFDAIGRFYHHFEQTDDREVLDVLRQAQRTVPHESPSD